MSEERLLNLLREAEPYLLDVCKQGGFHAVAAGELHTRISNILFLEKFKGILKQEPNEMEILRAELAALKKAARLLIITTQPVLGEDGHLWVTEHAIDTLAVLVGEGF